MEIILGVERPEGPKAHSIGQRPMYKVVGIFALKGQKHYLILELLPLQGELIGALYRRALPWAMCFLGFQPAFAEHPKFSKLDAAFAAGEINFRKK